MSEQEKKRLTVYELHNTEIKPKKMSEIIRVSLSPSSLQVNPLIKLYGAV